VEQLFAEGRIAEVADYCECDVVSTYRLWFAARTIQGAISAEQHERSELALSDFIVARIQDKPHWARLRAGAAVDAVVKNDGDWPGLTHQPSRLWRCSNAYLALIGVSRSERRWAATTQADP